MNNRKVCMNINGEKICKNEEDLCLLEEKNKITREGLSPVIKRKWTSTCESIPKGNKSIDINLLK